MRKILFLIIYLISFESFSQVMIEKVDIQSGKKFERLKPFLGSKIVSMPGFNNSVLQRASEEYKINEPFRFGQAQDVSISLNDGEWFEEGLIKRWKLTISSKDAYSINLIFDKLDLIEGAELYIYDDAFTTIMGPITYKNVTHKGSFWTDLLPGSTLKLELIEPINVDNSSLLSISKVIHGYVDTFSSGFGNSAPCNIDINCPQGQPFQTESNAIARLIVNNGQAFCSGALVSNTCNDLTPNLLTAFHCMDTNNDGVLSIAERDDAHN